MISKKERQKGFIALMSAIIISVVLLLMITTTSLTGFYGRFNIADSEYKERSSALADACVDTELLNLANNVSFTSPVTVGVDQCLILSVVHDAPVSGQTTIKTQGIFQNSYTNIVAIVNSVDLSIISWQEVPN